MHRPPPLTGQVVDRFGAPAARVPVVVAPATGGGRSHAATDTSGRFSFEDAPIGWVHLTADAQERGIASAWVHVDPSVASEQHLVLEPAGVLIVEAAPPLDAVAVTVIVRAERALASDPADVEAGASPDDDELVARGEPDAPLSVPAPRAYRVALVLRSGGERGCGVVFVAVGDEVVVRCGALGPAALEGRVVDEAARPLGGLELTAELADGRPIARAVTDASGHFTLSLTLDESALVSLRAPSPSGRPYTLVRQARVAPGERASAGDLVLRGPLPPMTAGQGWVGATFSLAPDGLHIVELAPGGPLAAAGAEDGDVILAIDGAPTHQLGPEEAVLRMRRAIGTEVVLTLRGADGHVYDVALAIVGRGDPALP